MSNVNSTGIAAPHCSPDLAGEVLQVQTVTTSELLSFRTVTSTKRGRYLSRNNFDVPDQGYGEGWVTGMNVAKELMAALQDHPIHPIGYGVSRIPLLDILKEAHVALEEGRGGGQGRRGAAVGLLRMLEAMLHFAAEHANHQAYIQHRIDDQQARDAEAETLRQRERQEKKQAFIARMAQSRQTRAAAQAG